MRIPLGLYTPDRPAIVNQKTLITARNAVPIAGGYGPQAGISAVSGFTALDARARGAISLVDPVGNPATYAGDETKLYRLGQNGTEDVSRTTGGAYNCSSTQRWEFALFGTTLIAVNPSDDTQYIDIRTGVNFRPLRGDAPNAPSGSTGAAPRAYHIGVVKDHIVLGDVIDNSFGHIPASIWWPQRSNPFHWPIVASDEAVAAESDRQPLQGGGKVQRVIGGAEVGVVFQESAISRMEYIGGDVTFNITRVEPNRGLLASGLAVLVGRTVYYCSEDGWYAFDYTTSTPIGRERIDRTFFSDFDSAYSDRVSCERDPNNQRFYVLYPGSGHTAGAPNKYLCFDWSLNQWTHGDIDAELLVPNGGYAATVSLDAPLSPDDAGDEDAVDTAGLPSFDTPLVNPGDQDFAAFDASELLVKFNGTALEATFETGTLELDPGWWTLVSELRPLVDGAIPSIAVAVMESLPTPGSSVQYGEEVLMDGDGFVTVHDGNGRYHRFKLVIPAGGFNSAVGIEIDGSVRTGSR